MTLGGIFPNWMIPVTVGDAVSQTVNQGDLVLADNAITVEIVTDPTGLTLPDVVEVVTIDDTPVVVEVVESTPIVTMDSTTTIIVERCD